MARRSRTPKTEEQREHREKLVNRPFANALSDLRSSLPRDASHKPSTLPAPGPGRAPGVPTETPPPLDSPDGAPRTLPAPGPSRPEPVPTRTPPAPESDTERYSYEDRVAFRQAFAGVRPLGEKGGRRAKSVRPPAPMPRTAEADEEARARLAALVAGGKKFRVGHDDEGVFGERSDAHDNILKQLTGRSPLVEAELDLHGMRANEARHAVEKFVRRARSNGARIVRIVHGRGHGSHGASTLDDVVVRTLTQGNAAASVLAFASAPARLGGQGALLVHLTFR